MNGLKSKRNDSCYTSTLVGILLILLNLSIGIFYIVIQWFRQGSIKDSLFVGMLIGATMILILGIKNLHTYFLNKGIDFYHFVMATENPEKGYKEYLKICDVVFNSKGMTIAGIIYGIIIGSSPFLLKVWSNDNSLKYTFSIFLFSINFITGIAFYILIKFFIHSIIMGKMVKVDLWQNENPSTNFIMGATRRISLLACIYISICISSILFSIIPVKNLVIAYSGFAGLIILFSFLIPTYPIAQKMKIAKLNALTEIDTQLNKEFKLILGKVKVSKSKVNMNKLETLLLLREKITPIPIWPFKIKSITTAFSVIFISSIPVILQFMLEKIIK